ncbi:hypothetical protein GTP44_01125 [Duganella sp. FT50W]|uniref:Uncharacterized protein n=1 Tax=Duganella lactea TaxID=2692173 RepID=A0A6L8MEH9_9BURK|nr:hypothetical protein [Duganella lactea]MYM80561.1 hypothetical protein [Duganella lactea]
MKNWKDELAAKLEAGQKPTYEQLEAALHGALVERNTMEQTVCDMARWLSRITVAHLDGDGSRLPGVVSEFIAERVKIKVEDNAADAPAAPAPATH